MIPGLFLFVADPGACDDGDEVETLSAGSQSTTTCSSEDSTVVGLDLSPKGGTRLIT